MYFSLLTFKYIPILSIFPLKNSQKNFGPKMVFDKMK